MAQAMVDVRKTVGGLVERRALLNSREVMRATKAKDERAPKSSEAKFPGFKVSKKYKSIELHLHLGGE